VTGDTLRDMERFDIRLRGGFVVLMIALGLMSCGLTPLLMWLVSVRHYPKSLDAEGVTIRDGTKLPWNALTARRRLILRRNGRQTVTGVGLEFGATKVAIAPRAFVDGERVLPYLSKVLGVDLTLP